MLLVEKLFRARRSFKNLSFLSKLVLYLTLFVLYLQREDRERRHFERLIIFASNCLKREASLDKSPINPAIYLDRF